MISIINIEFAHTWQHNWHKFCHARKIPLQKAGERCKNDIPPPPHPDHSPHATVMPKKSQCIEAILESSVVLKLPAQGLRSIFFGVANPWKDNAARFCKEMCCIGRQFFKSWSYFLKDVASIPRE
jgi:hypothetical protein